MDFPALFVWSASKTRGLTLVPMNPGITANNIGTLTHQGDGPLFGDGMIAVKLRRGRFFNMGLSENG